VAVNASSDQPLHRKAVESAAAGWLVKHDRGLTPAEQDEFLQWIAAAPEHRESFERHRGMWGEFNLLAQWRPVHSRQPNPDLLARPRRRGARRWAAPALLAAASVVLVWTGLPRWGEYQRADTAAEHAPAAYEAAGYLRQSLPDGSVVEMNRGAHLVVQFSPGERRIVLVEGEALFTVAGNPARPFVVRAGGVDVRALGTVFNVKLAGANLEVLVTEGRVHVASPATEAPGAAAAGRTAVIAELAAGQRTILPIAPVIAPPPVLAASSGEIERLLAWQPRLLDFNSTPLSEVVLEFNRRNAVQLVIRDEALRDLPIVASIRSDNVEGFVRLLEGTLDIRADRARAGEIGLSKGR
jgi:transmembrane sensor